MERDFFDWENWDGDEFAQSFLDCTLKQDIGPLKAGDFADTINVSYAKRVLEIYQEGELVYSTKIRLVLDE